MSPANQPPDISIRATPPSPKRLSRKVLLAGVCAAGLIVAFALVSGLSERPDRRGGAADAAVAAAGGPPESIQQASADYNAADLPRGHLDEEDVGGEDMLTPPQDALWSGAPDIAAPPRAEPAVDPREAAHVSPILFGEQRAQGEPPGNESRLDARLTPPRSRYEIQAGHVIPAALVTALNSDLPGRVIAQVTSPVYDSVTGDHLLIPQGARLIGSYDSVVAFGQSRALL
ncbi:MAG: hypothetical protein K2X34_07005, partial [Hyphomonadaceae bacterium]|nr:hypothetical protein [Hyphomonadaceae bacterium]